MKSYKKRMIILYITSLFLATYISYMIAGINISSNLGCIIKDNNGITTQIYDHNVNVLCIEKGISINTQIYNFSITLAIIGIIIYITHTSINMFSIETKVLEEENLKNNNNDILYEMNKSNIIISIMTYIIINVFVAIKVQNLVILTISKIISIIFLLFAYIRNKSINQYYLDNLKSINRVNKSSILIYSIVNILVVLLIFGIVINIPIKIQIVNPILEFILESIYSTIIFTIVILFVNLFTRKILFIKDRFKSCALKYVTIKTGLAIKFAFLIKIISCFIYTKVIYNIIDIRTNIICLLLNIFICFIGYKIYNYMNIKKLENKIKWKGIR